MYIGNNIIQLGNMATKYKGNKRNRILENIIKQILMTPITTPRETHGKGDNMHGIHGKRKQNHVQNQIKMPR
jgi:hypothetical protein